MGVCVCAIGCIFFRPLIQFQASHWSPPSPPKKFWPLQKNLFVPPKKRKKEKKNKPLPKKIFVDPFQKKIDRKKNIYTYIYLYILFFVVVVVFFVVSVVVLIVIILILILILILIPIFPNPQRMFKLFDIPKECRRLWQTDWIGQDYNVCSSISICSKCPALLAISYCASCIISHFHLLITPSSINTRLGKYYYMILSWRILDGRN